MLRSFLPSGLIDGFVKLFDATESIVRALPQADVPLRVRGSTKTRGSWPWRRRLNRGSRTARRVACPTLCTCGFIHPQGMGFRAPTGTQADVWTQSARREDRSRRGATGNQAPEARRAHTRGNRPVWQIVTSDRGQLGVDPPARVAGSVCAARTCRADVPKSKFPKKRFMPRPSRPRRRRLNSPSPRARTSSHD